MVLFGVLSFDLTVYYLPFLSTQLYQNPHAANFGPADLTYSPQVNVETVFLGVFYE